MPQLTDDDLDEIVLAVVDLKPGRPKSHVLDSCATTFKVRFSIRLNALISAGKLRVEPGKANAILVFPPEHQADPTLKTP